MNIAELPIAGIAFAPSETSTPTTGLADVPGAPCFNDVLSSLLGQLSDLTHPTDSGQGSLLQQLLALQGNGVSNVQDIVSALTDGKEDSFGQLGQTLLTLVSQLLEGAKADINTDELMPLLDDIMGSLASDKDAGGAKNVLIKLFANVKQSLAEGKLHGKLADLAKDLPETLKLKIHLIEHNSGKHSSNQEVAKIQYMLVAKLIGLTEQAPSDGEGSQTSDTANSVTGLLSEKLMVKFHITPSQPVVSVEGSQESQGAVTDAPVPAVDPALLGIPDNQATGDIADVDTDALLDQEGDNATASRVKDTVVQEKHQPQSAIKPPDVLAEAMNGQQATDRGTTVLKTTPHSHSFVHGAVKVSTGSEGALTDSQNGNESTADPGTTTTGTSSSTASYAVGAENKTVFANEVSQATATAGAGQATTQHATVNAENVLKQVVEKFDVLMAEGRSEAKIQLKPKYLGELKIHLVMENGTVKAALDAPSHHVKEILESNLSSLKQALEDQGFDVKGFDVSVGHRHNNHNHGFGRFKGASFMTESHQEPIGEIERIRPSVTLNRYGHKVVNFLA